MDNSSLRWEEGMRMVANLDGHEIVLDALEEKGGTNKGASPMKLVLASLMGCTTMDVVYILRKMRQDFTAVDVQVSSSERAEEHPKIFTKIHLTFNIKGNNLKENKVHEAVKLSQEKILLRCRHVQRYN